MPSKTHRRTAPAALPSLPGRSWRIRPRLRVRLCSRMKSAELDQALAAGSDPLASEQLLWRAQQLTEPRRRLELAETLQGIVDDVDLGRPQKLDALQTIRRDVIKANRALLLVLAERLRGAGPLALRGLAMVELLVRYGDSPLYRGPSPLQLKFNLLEALSSLDPVGS